jgi:hypothetical protein
VSTINAALIAFGQRWQLDGDLIYCRSCRRALIASRAGEPFVHASGCRNRSRLHPWDELRRRMEMLPAAAVPPEPGR